MRNCTRQLVAFYLQSLNTSHIVNSFPDSLDGMVSISTALLLRLRAITRVRPSFHYHSRFTDPLVWYCSIFLSVQVLLSIKVGEMI